MYNSGLYSAVSGSLLCFAFAQGGVDQIISHFDFKGGKFFFFDLRTFAESFGMTVEAMRAAVFLLFCRFNAKIREGSSPKLHRALIQPHESIFEFYFNESKANVQWTRKLLESLSRVRCADETGDKLVSRLREHAKLPRADFENFYNEIFTSQVVTDAGQIVCYPGKKKLTAKNYCFSVSQKSLLVNFCMQLLSDALLCLISPNYGYTWFHFSSYVINFQMTQMKSTYVKANLERNLFKVLCVLSRAEDIRYVYVPSAEKTIELRTDFFYHQRYPLVDRVNFGNEGSDLSVGPSQQLPVDIPEQLVRSTQEEVLGQMALGLAVDKSDKPLSVQEVLRLFAANKRPLVRLPTDAPLSISEMSMVCFLSVLEESGLICRHLNKVHQLGQLVQECVSPEFLEEAVVVLELIKCNGFTFLSENDLMRNFEDMVREDCQSNSACQSNGRLQQSVNPVEFNFQNKEELLHSLKVQEFEKRICVVDSGLKDFAELAVENGRSEALVADVCSLVADRAKGCVEFVSKFFTLMATNISMVNMFDYESCLFFEKVNLVLYSIYNSLTCTAAVAQMRFQKTDLKTVTRALGLMPFVKVFSFDLGILAKKLLTDFVIYRELLARGDSLADAMCKKLSVQMVQHRYLPQHSFVGLTERAFRFFKQICKLLEHIWKANQQLHEHPVFSNMAYSSTLFQEFHDFIVRQKHS